MHLKWQIWYCLFLSLFGHGTAAELRDEQLSRLFENGCNLRYYKMRKYISNVNCSMMAEVNPVCKRDNYVVAYSNVPPYSMHNCNKNCTHRGILQVYLSEIFNVCCMGCVTLSFQQVERNDDLFLNRTIPYDMIIPIENSAKHHHRYMTQHYSEIIKLKSITCITKDQGIDPDSLIMYLMYGTLRSWRLFILALVFAVCSGCVFWAIESCKDEEHFARKFYKGIFEGFWWAYISMTTVGYGDITPRSYPARLLAIAWIMFGIVLINMYTASLTSYITTQSSILKNEKLLRNDLSVGIMKNTKIILAAQDNEQKIKEFNDIDKMLLAFHDGWIEKIVLEKHMLTYYEAQLETLRNYLVLQSQQELLDATSMGFITYNGNLSRMVTSFIDANSDIMLKFLRDITRHTGSQNSRQSSSPFTLPFLKNRFPEGSQGFYFMLAAAAAISIISVLIRIIIRCLFKLKGKKTKI